MKKTKTLKKVSALLLSMLMAIGVMASSVTTAFAADPFTDDGSLEITKYLNADSSATGAIQGDDSKYYVPVAGVQYKIYKIGTFEQTTTAGVVEYTYTGVTGLTLTAATKAKDVDVDALSLTALDTKTTAANGKLKFENLDAKGVYLVKETVTPDGVSAANNFIITVPMYVNGAWISDIEASPKNTTNDIDIDKEVAGDIVNVSNNLSSWRGAELDYEITVTLPSDAKEGGYTKFNVIDTPTSNLTIDKSTIAITYYKDGDISNNDVSNKISITNIIGYDDTTMPGSIIFNFMDSTPAWKAFDIENGGVVVISYSATIDADATGTITNNARIDYATEDDEDPTDPPTTVVEIDLYDLNGYKVDENDAAKAGAKFALLQGTDYWAYNSTNGWYKAASLPASGAANEDDFYFTSGSDGC